MKKQTTKKLTLGKITIAKFKASQPDQMSSSNTHLKVTEYLKMGLLQSEPIFVAFAHGSAETTPYPKKTSTHSSNSYSILTIYLDCWAVTRVVAYSMLITISSPAKIPGKST